MKLGYAITYSCNNVTSIEGNMLHAGTAIILDIFLDLRAFLPWRRLIDRHLHRLFPIRHYDRP